MSTSVDLPERTKRLIREAYRTQLYASPRGLLFYRDEKGIYVVRLTSEGDAAFRVTEQNGRYVLTEIR